ncbi:MAG: OmpA family protein [Labilithrix sp.]|nr:OmpA family protein [Labilithrix sp.]MCW5816168.1 OmpA family protein [Labilithrix sp.]
MRSLLALALVAVVSGCAKKPPAKDTTEVTSARAPKRSVAVSDDIMKACKIQLDNIERAPKFDFDDADLLPEDRDVLEQVARCVTTGPLKGRALSLVGRCDPRGELEYNMVLGDYRAESVHTYLARLGVDPAAMAKTTRGDLDAEGKDEEGWQRDRRVDLSLQPAKR